MSSHVNFEIDFFPSKPGTKTEICDSDALALALSTKLVSFFQEKINEFKLIGIKISMHQLKSVYKTSAEGYSEVESQAKNRGHFALARVNMFIRMLSEKNSFYKKVNKSKAKTNQLLLDITSSFGPIEEDFTKASLDIEKHELAYDFQSVNELYLEAPEDSGLWFEL